MKLSNENKCKCIKEKLYKRIDSLNERIKSAEELKDFNKSSYLLGVRSQIFEELQDIDFIQTNVIITESK